MSLHHVVLYFSSSTMTQRPDGQYMEDTVTTLLAGVGTRLQPGSVWV